MPGSERDVTSRRTLLLGSGTALVTAVAGCSQDDTGGTTPTGDATDTEATPTTEQPADTDTPGGTTVSTTVDATSLVEAVESEGYYVVNNAGTRTDPPFDHLYRSPSDPLRLDTDVGGVVTARPHDRGIELSADLTADDRFAGSSVYFGRWRLRDITEIDFTVDGDEVRLVLQLDLNDDGDFLDWESVGNDRERFRGFDGDDRAISNYLTEGPVAPDDAIFGIPPGGAREPARDLSIEDLQELGDVAVWIGAGLDHQGLDLPGSRAALITELTVTTT